MQGAEGPEALHINLIWMQCIMDLSHHSHIARGRRSRSPIYKIILNAMYYGIFIIRIYLTRQGAKGPRAPHLNTFPDCVNPWERAKPPTPCEARASRRLVMYNITNTVIDHIFWKHSIPGHFQFHSIPGILGINSSLKFQEQFPQNLNFFWFFF